MWALPWFALLHVILVGAREHGGTHTADGALEPRGLERSAKLTMQEKAADAIGSTAEKNERGTAGQLHYFQLRSFQKKELGTTGNPRLDTEPRPRFYEDAHTSLWGTPAPIFGAKQMKKETPTVEDVRQVSAPHCGFLSGVASIVGTMGGNLVKRIMHHDVPKKIVHVRLYTALQYLPMFGFGEGPLRSSEISPDNWLE